MGEGDENETGRGMTRRGENEGGQMGIQWPANVIRCREWERR